LSTVVTLAPFFLILIVGREPEDRGRVVRRTADPDLEVQVRSGGVARGTRAADLAARALRAALPEDADTLSEAERFLLREWLTRLAADGGTPHA
jgi:hypothetical protein